jgi:acetyltransferase-like isoleucine patch superfamily enzyme
VLGQLKELAATKGYRAGWLSLCWFTVVYFTRSYLLLVIARIAPPGLTTLTHRLRGVKIGNRVYIDRFAVIDGSYPELIVIEDEVRIAPGAVVVAHYQPGATLARVSPPYRRPVRLCRSCFIGVNAVIMPGVTIGECAIVTGGSVVLTDVPAYNVVIGNPARVVSCLKTDQAAERQTV